MRGRLILNSTMVIFQWTGVSAGAHSGIDSSSKTGWADRKVYCSLAVILPPTFKLSILMQWARLVTSRHSRGTIDKRAN
ncbi:hypothetical protein K438DRAFT_680227 [Mycena galopus ATCC 62051]|nr:hypothetical protein K438DRAFT_680227 [Mycena galopus ATCC 62051]